MTNSRPGELIADAPQLVPFYGKDDTVRILNGRTMQPETNPKWAGVWKVVSQGPANVRVRQGAVEGRVPWQILAKTDDPYTAEDDTDTVASDLPNALFPATLVRLSDAGVRAANRTTGGRWSDVTADTVLVVIADKGERVNLTRLGGAEGRYIRMARAGIASVVDPAEVLK